MPRDATGHLGQEEWHLLELLDRQGAGEICRMPFDDRTPDTGGVEFGMLLRTGPLLFLHDLEIQLSDLVSAQVYALVREEVCHGTKDLIYALLGQDPDQRAVHVEGDRSNVHAVLSTLLSRPRSAK